MRGATFSELKSLYGRSPTIDFGLTWDDDATPVARAEIRILGGGFRAIEWIESIATYTRDGTQLLHLLLKDDLESRYDVSVVSGPSFESRLNFDGLVPTVKDSAPPWPEAATSQLNALRDRLLSLADDIYWLSAVRAVPPRRSEIRGRPQKIRYDGSGAAEHLAYAQTRDRLILDEVRAFYREATGHDLYVEEVPIGNAYGFSLTLSALNGPDVRVNLLDTGEGMAQVLPVAVLGALATHKRLGEHPLIVLEHPEIHLHPRAHEDVAAYFVRVAASKAARFIVETHSEHFLSRVQLAVLRGEIAPEQVLVCWVWQHESGSSVEPMRLDELARFIGDKWPPGVFSEDTALQREIIAERRKRAGAL